MNIRRAVVTDAAEIALVHVSAWRDTYAGLMPEEVLEALSLEDRTAAWKSLLTLPTSDVTLVAEDGEQVVGFVTVGQPQHPDDRDASTAELIAIYVSRPGRGVGTALLDAAEAEMRATGSHRAILWVLDRNDAARSFYTSKGWTGDAMIRPHVVNGAELTVTRHSKTLVPRADG